jgi:hypothetical protein
MVLLASDYDKSKYLRAEDLKAATKFRIKSVTEEVFEQDRRSEKKLVIWLTTIEQGLVLNKINNRTIRGAFDDDTAGWVGKVIIVYPAMTDIRGKLTPCLRVRIPPPKQPATVAAPQQPVTPGNGAAAIVAPAAPPTQATRAAADPELEPDPIKLIEDDLEDEIPF